MELTTTDAGIAGAAEPTRATDEPKAGGGDSGRLAGEEALDDLRRRRDDGEELPASTGLALDLAGIRLVGADLAGLDLTGADLSAAQLLNCDLSGSRPRRLHPPRHVAP